MNESPLDEIRRLTFDASEAVDKVCAALLRRAVANYAVNTEKADEAIENCLKLVTNIRAVNIEFQSILRST